MNRDANSPNKQTIQQYLDGFQTSDHAKILDCLTDDVVWDMPGQYRWEGKAAFDKEIENDAFVGSPTLYIKRIVEENGVVIAEGAVSVTRKDGGALEGVFCDVYEMEHTKIKVLTSYQVDLT